MGEKIQLIGAKRQKVFFFNPKLAKDPYFRPDLVVFFGTNQLIKEPSNTSFLLGTHPALERGAQGRGRADHFFPVSGKMASQWTPLGPLSNSLVPHTSPPPLGNVMPEDVSGSRPGKLSVPVTRQPVSVGNCQGAWHWPPCLGHFALVFP